MAISKDIIRFEGYPDGTDDPPVNVWLKKTITDPDTGEVFEKIDGTPSLSMKLSELIGTKAKQAIVPDVAIAAQEADLEANV